MDSNTFSDQVESLEHDIEAISNDRHVEDEEENSRLTRLEKDLSLVFFKNFREDKEIEDLRKAIVHAGWALSLYRQADQEKQTLLVNLGNMQFMEYRSTKSLTVLDEAISNISMGIQIPFKDDKQKVSLLQNYWLVLRSRIAHCGTLQDVQEAIDTLRKCLNAKDGLQYLDPDMFRDLLALYLMKFDLVDGYPDLDAAIKAAEFAIKLSEEDDPEREKFLHNLATFLEQRFRLKGKEEDLTRSIGIWQQLVTATGRSRTSLNGLSLALHNKYLLTGGKDDLEEAIQLSRESIEGVQEGDEAHAAVLMNLGIWLGARFDLLERDTDIDEAIHFGNEAVKVANNEHDRLTFRNNLATFNCSRYMAKGNAADMDMAVKIGRELVEKSSNDDFANSAYAGNLSSWLQDRYDATGALIDLQESIDFGRQSILDRSAPSMDQVTYKSNLAERLSRWHA